MVLSFFRWYQKTAGEAQMFRFSVRRALG